jgi:spoIIIJ-associated protein
VIIIKADTLEIAMSEASEKFDCSVTQLHIEVVEHPKPGVLGFFKKQAVIAVVKKESDKAETVAKDATPEVEPKVQKEVIKESKEQTPVKKERQEKRDPKPKAKEKRPERKNQSFASTHTEVINPSLVTAQDDYDEYDENEYKKSEKPSETRRSKEDIQRRIAEEEKEVSSIKRVSSSDSFKQSPVVDDFFQSSLSMDEIASEVDKSVNSLFEKSCFALEKVKVSAYDDNTLLIEFKGDDAALLIGKEGYRYKALSYMLFNWINAKYGVQLRLEIADFLKNQEEMVHKYLLGVNEQIENNGRAQTKILDGVLVQIALKKLRSTFPDKYIAIRTNRDGLKYIIINSFRNNNG